MIARTLLSGLGYFAKPHGVRGELSAIIEGDYVPAEGQCVFVELDGLLVPFTVTGVRPKSAEAVLLSLKGVTTEEAAARFAGKALYVEKALLPEGDDEDSEDFYLDDLVGFTILDEASGVVGTITGYDDSTENVLFMVSDADGLKALIPASDDWIIDIDTSNKTIKMTLPEGLLSL